MNDFRERNFPNHTIEREIGLAEYSLAAERLSNQDRAISWSANVATIIATFVGFSSFKIGDLENEIRSNGLEIETIKSLFLLTIMIFSIFSIIHIANLIKSQTFSERKIIVLRRMLGVSYGENSLILPNWRIEGADHPFSIHLFPGFLSYKAFPVWIIVVANVISIIFLGSSLKNIPIISEYFGSIETFLVLILLSAFWTILSLLVFKIQLNEANENFRLWLAKFGARTLNVPITKNIEQTIYNIRIDIAEMHRVKTDLVAAKKITVEIEDKAFFRHSGINWRGTFRAIFELIFKNKKSGGSSITQQFCRSNFITRLSPTIGRKIVEMLLAKWVESVWDKNEILDAYLSTVRFDYGTYGFHRAYKHFFEESPTSVERWEAFILIERLGNIRGKFLGRRVYEILLRLVSMGSLKKDDAVKALDFYESSIGHHFEQAANDWSPKEVRDRISTL